MASLRGLTDYALNLHCKSVSIKNINHLGILTEFVWEEELLIAQLYCAAQSLNNIDSVLLAHWGLALVPCRNLQLTQLSLRIKFVLNLSIFHFCFVKMHVSLNPAYYQYKNKYNFDGYEWWPISWYTFLVVPLLLMEWNFGSLWHLDVKLLFLFFLLSSFVCLCSCLY